VLFHRKIIKCLPGVCQSGWFHLLSCGSSVQTVGCSSCGVRAVTPPLPSQRSLIAGHGAGRWCAGQIAAAERAGARRRRWRLGDLRVFDRERARSSESSRVVLPAGIAQHSQTGGCGEEVLRGATLAGATSVLFACLRSVLAPISRARIHFLAGNCVFPVQHSPQLAQMQQVSIPLHTVSAWVKRQMSSQ